MTDRTEEMRAVLAAANEALVDSTIPETPEDDAPEKHTVLEVWQAVLSNIEVFEAQPITMAMAMKITASYPQLRIQDTADYMALYNIKLKEMRAILNDEIEADPDCFKNVEEDAEDNHHHYLNVLAGWQRLMHLWEQAFDVTDDDAMIELASTADVGQFVLGSEGLSAHLREIDFQYTEDDAAEVFAAVMAE